MKKAFGILILAAVAALAQEHPAQPPASAEHAPAENHGGGGAIPEVAIGWKWANFAILAFGLGFLIAKNAPGYFASRNAEIRSGIEEGARLQREANERAAAIDARLASLQNEIAELRAKAKADISAEADRIKKETADGIAKLQAHTENEIAAAAKQERAQLKSFAAGLALELAEDRLREQLTPETDSRLIGNFLKGLRN